MAHIKIKGKGQEFSGHIGPVHFTNGEADTEVPAMVAHFQRDPDRYDVTEDEAKPKRSRSRKPKGKSGDESADQGAPGPEGHDESEGAADGDQDSDKGAESDDNDGE